MHPEASNRPRGPSAPSDCLFAGSSGVTPGEAEEASLAVPPSVLTLGVNRNIKSLLGGQETGNNQNIVSCPRPGRWAVCHRPSPAAWGFPGLASARVTVPTICFVGSSAHSGPHPRTQLVRHRRAGSHPTPTHGHHPARDVATGLDPHQPLDPRERGRARGEGLRRWRGSWELMPATLSLLQGRAPPACSSPEARSQLGGLEQKGVGEVGGLPSHPRALGPQAPFPTDLPPQRALQEPVGVPRSPQWPLSEGETEAQPLVPGPFP